MCKCQPRIETIRPSQVRLGTQIMQMNPDTPLWKRGDWGDFPNIILKSPCIPLCQRGIKNQRITLANVNYHGSRVPSGHGPLI
jgi:hypothetical protein